VRRSVGERRSSSRDRRDLAPAQRAFRLGEQGRSDASVRVRGLRNAVSFESVKEEEFLYSFLNRITAAYVCSGQVKLLD